MKIQSITSNFIPNIKFKGETIIGPEFKHNKIESCGYDDDEFIENTNDLDDAKGCLGIASGFAIVGAIAAVALGLIKCSSSNDKQNTEFIQNVVNVVQADDTRKDTIIIKDVTDDENPDLILYKNDGSKVVIDINNQTIK